VAAIVTSMTRRAEWGCYVLGTIPGALLAFAAWRGLVPEKVALAVFALSFVGLNLAHMAATWSRVYLTPRGWRSAPVERLYLPAALMLGAICFEATGWGATLLVVQYYLSLHHATLQNYGILRATQRRAGRSLEGAATRLDQAACLLLPLGALLYRSREISHTYSTAPVPPPPQWLVASVMGAGAVALAAFLAREALASRAGEPVDPIGVGMVLSTNVVWTALLVGIDHPAIPLYALASSHYIQYLYFVWRFEQARPGLELVPARLRPLVAPPSRLAYLAGLTALGGGVVVGLTLLSVVIRAALSSFGLRPVDALDIPPWAAAMIGVNLSHYWLDHRIWRSPRVARPLTAA
jgi:hypothetical protein